MARSLSTDSSARTVAQDYVAAVLLSIAIIGLRQSLEPLLHGQAPLIALLAAPILSAWYGGYGPGLLALVLCGVGGQLLFLDPRGGPVPDNAVEWLRFGLYAAIGLLSVWLISTRRQALDRLQRDHGELLAAEKVLALREQRARQTFEAAPSGMLLLDAQGRVTEVNREAERLFGADGAALLGQPIDALVPGAWRGLPLLAAPAAGPAAKRELRGRRPDGSVFTVQIGLTPLEDASEGLVLASVLDLSEQREAQAALRHSRAQLQQLFETNLLGIMFWTMEREVLDANDELLRIWGRDRASFEREGLRLSELTPADHAEADRRSLEELRATGRLQPVEKEYQRPDGSRVWVLVGSAMTGEGRGVSFVLDISARKQAELRLRDSEQRARESAERAEAERAVLDAILDAAPVGILVADPRGQLVRQNPANTQLWGPAPVASGDTAADTWRQWKGWWADKSARHGEPVQLRDWAMARALRGEVVRNDMVEIEPFDRPGERRAVVNSAAPVRDAQGRITGAVVTQVDVSALAAAQAALEENAAMFQGLADNIAQLAWMTDATGYITWYNRRWFDYTGSTLEAMKGWGWQWVHHPEHVGRVVAKFRRHIASGEPWEDTFPLRGKDGTYRWFLSRAFPLHDRAGRIVSWFGTNTDVTAQRQAEEALRDADRRKDDFIAVLAHELRNPLAPVRNAVEILKRVGGTEPRVERVRDVIDRQVSHMARLIDDLLDVSRIARGKLTLRKEACDLAAIVCQTAEDYRASLEAAQQALVLHGCEGPAWVEGDAVRLAQMLGNLLTNAARFQTQPGTVDVHTVRDEASGQVRVTVSDTGMGMDEELLGRLFDPFAQATQDMARSKGGLGLGLALTKGLAELHGGTITAASDGLGRGSRFTLTLPLARMERPGREAVDTGGETEPLRILVIEDNHDAAATLGELLQLGGHEVELAFDGAIGIDKARTMRPDVVISDIGLPGSVSGYDVGRTLRAEPALEGMALIALSGYADAAARQRCADAGFDTHLAKPPDLHALEQALAMVNARGLRPHAATEEDAAT